MSLLTKLGLFNKPSKAKEAISFHPDCYKHVSLLSDYLAGANIDVLNPSTKEWEKCPNPVFDPELEYKLSFNTPPTLSTHPILNPIGTTGLYISTDEPEPPTGMMGNLIDFNRGDIWESNGGKKYLVLCDKRKVLPNYDPQLDPDSGSIVVMSYDENTKNKVNCRKTSGFRHDNNSEYTLVSKLDSINLTMPCLSNSKVFLHSRSTSTDVYLCAITGEVLFR